MTFYNHIGTNDWFSGTSVRDKTTDSLRLRWDDRAAYKYCSSN